MTGEEFDRRIVEIKLDLASEPMLGQVQKKAILDNLIKSLEIQLKDSH